VKTQKLNIALAEPNSSAKS